MWIARLSYCYYTFFITFFSAFRFSFCLWQFLYFHSFSSICYSVRLCLLKLVSNKQRIYSLFPILSKDRPTSKRSLSVSVQKHITNMSAHVKRVVYTQYESHQNIKYLVLTEMKVVWIFFLRKKYETNVLCVSAIRISINHLREWEIQLNKKWRAQKHMIMIRRWSKSQWKKKKHFIFVFRIQKTQMLFKLM